MLKTYDSTQQAFVMRDSAKYYNDSHKAWTETNSAKTYDAAQAAWVERLKKFMDVSVGSGFYDNSGNIIFLADGVFHCEVRPTSKTYSVEFKLEDDFTNPVITCEYSFGHSDTCPNIASNFLSHACIDWVVKGYLNGAEVASKTIAAGSGYAYEKIFNEPKSVTLEGTFDEIRLICRVGSFSGYKDYNKANTSIDNFTIDGKKYGAKAQAINS